MGAKQNVMSMKMFLRLRYLPVIAFALMAAPFAHAATSPDLGAAASYSVLSGADATNGGAGVTTISGNLGVSPSAAYNDLGTTVFLTPGNPHLADGSAAAAQSAQKAVFDGPLDFVQQPCTVTYPATTELSTAGPLDPGVYCTLPGDDFLISGTVTLRGTSDPATDVWIFRTSDDLIASGPASVVFTGTGGLACNVWWRVADLASFTANNAMVGNILAATSISLGQSATLNGRAFAFTGAVTMLGNTISGPTCAAAAPPASGNTPPLINIRKVPNPLALPAGPGPVTYTYTLTNPGLITMTNITLVDDKCTGTTYVSGDTNLNSWMETNETWLYTCTTMLDATTVNYATARGLGNGMAAVDTAIAQVIVGIPVVPPLINIVKTPAPLTLPFSGGSVVYSYVVTNPGTVAMSNVTVTDNRCSGVTRVSGDVNGDSLLQVSETWRYTCTTNIPFTTVNTAIATGQANGLTAVDTALATVVVAGLPLPPLVHIVKMPNPVLLPVGGGSVTYTYAVTNPGTVPLSNVSVGDDRCGPVNVVSGDGNGNGLMETYETWLYSCVQNLTVATTNTATASGQANGITVTDVAVASVAISPAIFPPPVVSPTASPKLPSTGIDPNGGPMVWMFATAGLLLAASLLFALTKWKKFF